MTPGFWSGKRVFVTGHTGFKGGWLSLWLHSLGAAVKGFALRPPTDPSLFEVARIDRVTESFIGDIRDSALLARELAAFAPTIVFHLAAQPIVRSSYDDPIGTYSTNVLGTVHLLEAVRKTPSVRAVVNVTSDKCYENKEWIWGYRENEPMGGYDPYSSSKGCAELVNSAYLQSFFNPARYAKHQVALASARAGNVIGGGDWAPDRLFPDIMRSFIKGETVRIRNPHAVRPWQHVLEPLSGYLALAERLSSEGPSFSGGWNFGPHDEDSRPVNYVLALAQSAWEKPTRWEDQSDPNAPHEAGYLRLDISKAQQVLGWSPRWSLKEAVAASAAWYSAAERNEDMQALSLAQIEMYCGKTNGLGRARSVSMEGVAQ
jgi:CDP-glucose 4,6-dehydratase